MSSSADGRSLLRIDFAAALAKLAPAQMEGSWQLPAELARLAIAAGAVTVEVRLASDRLELAAPGARLIAGTVRDLGHILDEKQPAVDRHRALVALEQHDALALASLASFVTGRVRLVSGGADGIAMEVGPDASPRYVASQEERLSLLAEGLELDVRAAGEWLQRKGRFSPVPIVYQGKEIFRGFYAPLIRTRLTEPVPARLAITARGESPRLWLLRHGIVSTRATVPGFPAFEAAVEMSGHAKPGATGAALRERINPFLDPLINAAVGLTLKLSRHLRDMPDDVRVRTARLLLEAARRGRLFPEIRTAAVFPLVPGGGVAGGGRRLVSMDDIAGMVRYEDGQATIDALVPEQDPRNFAIAGPGALVLSAGERKLLSEVTGTFFTTPRPRPRVGGSPLRAAAHLAGRAAFAWHGLRGRLIAEDQLADDERTFLAVLRTALQTGKGAGAPRRAVFRHGGGRVRATAGGEILLPRDNPAVRDAVRAVARDPSWLYPALLSLYGAHDLPAPELRRRWLGRGGNDEADVPMVPEVIVLE